MSVKIKCFGIAREIIAKDEILLDEAVQSVGALKDWIHATYPEMKNVNGFMIAVDQEYANDELEINSNSEIAIIPPVSGG